MEILERVQKEVFHCLREIPEADSFYLTGGTALSAFYLRHRRSDDLDFFTSTEELILPFTTKIERSLQARGTRQNHTAWKNSGGFSMSGE